MLFDLFLTFLKIGTFTFGGGYAMIPIVKDICVDERHWLDETEFLNMLTVSESTPGPVAINMATYIGYKRMGLKGAIVSTIGVVFSSYVIIFLISLFFEDVLKNQIIANAFKGIRIAVSLVILNAVFNLIKKEYKDSKHKIFTLFLFITTFALMFITNILGYRINTVYVIIASFIFAYIMSEVSKV